MGIDACVLECSLDQSRQWQRGVDQAVRMHSRPTDSKSPKASENPGARLTGMCVFKERQLRPVGAVAGPGSTLWPAYGLSAATSPLLWPPISKTAALATGRGSTCRRKAQQTNHPAPVVSSATLPTTPAPTETRTGLSVPNPKPTEAKLVRETRERAEHQVKCLLGGQLLGDLLVPLLLGNSYLKPPEI